MAGPADLDPARGGHGTGRVHRQTICQNLGLRK
jgi:hypothetical protein